MTTNVNFLSELKKKPPRVRDHFRIYEIREKMVRCVKRFVECFLLDNIIFTQVQFFGTYQIYHRPEN